MEAPDPFSFPFPLPPDDSVMANITEPVVPPEALALDNSTYQIVSIATA